PPASARSPNAMRPRSVSPMPIPACAARMPHCFLSPDHSRKPAMSDMPFPTPDQAITRHLLERQAREHPDDLYMRFQDGSEWSFAEALEQAHRAAAALKKLGVGQGDHVF